MKLAVILPTRQNKPLEEKISQKLDKGDKLIAVDFPREPARKLDEIIWRHIESPDYSILFISPAVTDVTDDFIDVFKAFAGDTEEILVRSPFEEFDDFYLTDDVKLLRNVDCILFKKSLYRRQLMDISPHVDHVGLMRELIKGIGRGRFYTPLRDQKKIMELWKMEESIKKSEEEKKREILAQKLASIKERRRIREEQRTTRIIDLQKLKEDISRLEEELSRQEEELSRQEEEFKNSEKIFVSEIERKEEELKRIRLRISDKEIFLKRVKDVEAGKEYLGRINKELEEYKRKEQEISSSIIVPPIVTQSMKEKPSVQKISLKKRISDAKRPRPQKRPTKEWMREDSDTRVLVLSKEPISEKGITKVKKIDWD